MKQKPAKEPIKDSYCPKCKSHNITLYMGWEFGKYECQECGYLGPVVLQKGKARNKDFR